MKLTKDLKDGYGSSYDFWEHPEDYGCEFVARCGGYQSYAWEEVVIAKDADGSLFWIYDSGCSCNSLEQNTPNNFIPLNNHTKEACLKAAKKVKELDYATVAELQAFEHWVERNVK